MITFLRIIASEWDGGRFLTFFGHINFDPRLLQVVLASVCTAIASNPPFWVRQDILCSLNSVVFHSILFPQW